MPVSTPSVPCGCLLSGCSVFSWLVSWVVSCELIFPVLMFLMCISRHSSRYISYSIYTYILLIYSYIRQLRIGNGKFTRESPILSKCYIDIIFASTVWFPMNQTQSPWNELDINPRQLQSVRGGLRNVHESPMIWVIPGSTQHIVS